MTTWLINKEKYRKVLLDKFLNVFDKNIDMNKIIASKLLIPTGNCKLGMFYLLIFLLWFYLFFYLLTLGENWKQFSDPCQITHLCKHLMEVFFLGLKIRKLFHDSIFELYKLSNSISIMFFEFFIQFDKN